jgi:hypothetical protein
VSAKAALPTFLIASAYLADYNHPLPQAEGHFGYFNAKTFIVGRPAACRPFIELTIILSVASLLSLTLFAYYFSLSSSPSLELQVSQAQPPPLASKPSGDTGGMRTQHLVALSPLVMSSPRVWYKAAGAGIQRLYPASRRLAQHPFLYHPVCLFFSPYWAWDTNLLVIVSILVAAF